MPKKTKSTKEDFEAFYKAVKGVTPLKKRNKHISHRPPFPVSHRRFVEHDEPLIFTESEEIHTVLGEEFIVFRQAGVSNKILRKLRKGQYNVDAMLDLHGMTVDEAKTIIDQFLRNCLQQKLRVILIIHGKGHHSQKPILKNKLNQWLREINFVLAFCSASPSHGSRGAIYVLLKRSLL